MRTEISYIKAFKTVWIIYSVTGFLTLLAALIIPGNMLLNATPVCYSVRQFGKECFMCGSTRGFILAGRGKFTEAMQMNKLSLVLFFLIIANTFLLLYTLTKKKHETS